MVSKTKNFSTDDWIGHQWVGDKIETVTPARTPIAHFWGRVAGAGLR
jgi:hypothetical protein